jgi:hypothetical protein
MDNPIAADTTLSHIGIDYSFFAKLRDKSIGNFKSTSVFSNILTHDLSCYDVPWIALNYWK